MKRIIYSLVVSLLLLCVSGCSHTPSAQIVATTLPVYEFTTRLCKGTPLWVARLINEDISCLHDYSLQTRQMRISEKAEVMVISGAGLETFLDDLLSENTVLLDASEEINLICTENDEDHEKEHGHHHSGDPHIWLSPVLAVEMCENIYQGLVCNYPQYRNIFENNFNALHAELDALLTYGNLQLATLNSRELITFHDGFSYLADAFDLTILHAVEEESGSEASAAELINIADIVSEHHIRTIFTERNGSTSAAQVIAQETGVSIYPLDMCISGGSYFDAMYKNIDILKEALG